MSENEELTPEELGIGRPAAKTIDISIVLDKSGSMMSIADDVIGGFNSFVQEQKKSPGTAILTLVEFDYPSAIKTVINAVNLSLVEDLTPKSYTPRGNTALLDAIGKTIADTKERVNVSKPDQVLFVIVTDGHENASVEYNREQINKEISSLDGDWQFVFLAANQDAIKEGADLGIASAGSSMTYGATGQGVTQSFNSLSDSSTLYRARSEKTTPTFFTDEEKDKQVDVKNERGNS